MKNINLIKLGLASSSSSSGKESACNAEDTGDQVSIPGSGISCGGKYSSPLQYSCLENPMDGGAWRAAVLSVAKSLTQVSTHAVMHAHNLIKLGDIGGYNHCRAEFKVIGECFVQL